MIEKLDEFIRKYYRNQLIKGGILFIAIFLINYLVISSLEYFGHFGVITRSVLFYLFIFANSAVFVFYLVIPILKIRKIGRRITYEQAALIIGRHFPEISDKLLNTLQLHNQSLESNQRTDLLIASIDQKITRLRPVPFTIAIDLSKNRRFLKYALPPLFMFMLLMLIAPSFVTRPAERIIYHNRAYIEEMPFHMTLLDKNLEAFQQEDFTVHLKVTGDRLPDEVFIDNDGITYKLNKESKILFSYTFRTLQKDKRFSFVAGKYRSQEYFLKVFPKPVILSFEADLKFPSYIKRKNETLGNTGDLIIPEGTAVTWRFFTKDVDKVILHFDTVKRILDKTETNAFEYSSTFKNNKRYILQSENSFTQSRDSLAFTITVIQDAFPSIQVNETKDSSLNARLFFQGVIKDDYGFSRLSFVYTLLPQGDTTKKTSKSIEITINGDVNQQQFYYSVNTSEIIKDPGDELEYYFEVCDNDGIHGPKCSRSEQFMMKAPTLDEIEKMTDKKEQSITQNMENALKQSKQLDKEIEDLNKRLYDKSTLNWQDKKQIEELLNKENEIKENMDKVQQQNDLKNSLEEQYKNIDPSIMEKQKKLNELFNNVMDDEMKKMIEQMKDMLDKIDKDKVNQMLEKMKFSNKDLEKELDRNLDLFKQLEFEKDLSETIDKLNKLADKQDKLSDSTGNSDKKDAENNDKLKEEQKGIKKEYDNQDKKLDELEKKNKELEEPNNFPNTDQEQKDIKDNLNSSEQNLRNNNPKNASKSQKKAASGMRQMAQKLEAMKEGMEMEQDEEDVNILRQILENLVRISFSQEDLMNLTKTISRNDPKYLKLIEDQNNLKEDLSMVEDSLQALAKREIRIKPYIMREIASINRNVSDAVDNLNERNVQPAGTKQQFIMTSVNNLALLLSDALKQMESNLNSQMQAMGNSSCTSKGGKGKMSLKSMRQMQESLNKNLEKMKKEMESQKQQGQNKKSSMGNQGMSEQLARMAAEQEEIRNEMRKYLEQQKEEGNKNAGELNSAMMQMEETEKDLVNKKILQETLNRQQQILTRLLESEKAEMKREQEQRRQSTEAKNQKYSNFDSNFKYNNIKSSSVELMKTVQPEYNYFYKNKINGYFLKFEN